jgi:putative MATE family efflux protein
MMQLEEHPHSWRAVFTRVFRLGWPAVASMILETLLSITDAFWVGKLGATPMAAVTSAMFPIWTMFSLLTILSTGVVAIISRAFGAKATAEVERTGSKSLSFAIWAGVGYAVMGYFLAPIIFAIMGTNPDVTHLGIMYLRIFFLGVIFFFVNDTLAAVFRAMGDTRAQLIASSAAVLLNIVLDPLMIFGIGPFPAWGTSGASTATIISAAFGTLLYMWMIKRGRLGFVLRLRLFEKIDFGLVKAIVRIGSPPAISGLVFSVIYIFLNRIVAGFGTESIAAMMVGNRLESISYLSSFGFSMAASALVGQSLGAGDIKQASQSVWASFSIGGVFTLVISAAFLLIPRQLAIFFIDDERVVVIAIDYLRILALSQVFMAAEIILEGSFAGAGNTMPPMVVSIPGSILRLPLAWYLSDIAGLGINGVWWTLTITTWLKAIALIWWFSLGRWKRTGLIQTGATPASPEQFDTF